jgi:hypothetical protein
MRLIQAAKSALLAVAVATVAVPVSAQTQAAMSERDTGPKHLIITYHCPPATRAAFREFMTAQGLRSFASWKSQGVLKDYHVLFNWFVDADAWDMLSILSLDKYGDVDKWRQVEKSSPGGLSRDGLALCAPSVTYAMDLLWQRHSPTVKSNPEKSVFLVIPYVYYPASTLDQYTSYVSGYVIPQFDAWIRDNILVGYRIFVNRFQTARPWQAVFVLEYRDTEAFGEREKEVDKVKAQLQKDENWKALGDRKLSVRTEKETAAAEELVPRQ